MFDISTGIPVAITDADFRARIAPAAPPRSYRRDEEFLAQFGVVSPSREARPDFDASTQTCLPDDLPTLQDGAWVLGWTVSQISGEVRLSMASRECQRRIYAVADQFAQINMASAAAAGALTSGQMDAYREGLTWIGAMRATWRALAADETKDLKADENWPACPRAVQALADAF